MASYDSDSDDGYFDHPGNNLFDWDMSWVINKPEILYNIYDTDFDVALVKFNSMFIMLAKESGLIGKATTSRIDLENSSQRISSELKELFQPQFDDEMTFQEYISGISRMASSYAVRSPFVQAKANLYLQSAVAKAERRAGNDFSYIDVSSQEGTFLAGPEPSASQSKKPANLFRSSSTGSEQFRGETSYFIPNDETTRVLRACFSDFFVRDGGETSIKYDEAPVALQNKYKQLWQLFAGGDGTVRRSDFIACMCTAAENFLAHDRQCERVCTMYTVKKLDVAVNYLKCMLDDKFPVGTKVFLKDIYDNGVDLPAEIVSTSECKCGGGGCKSPLLFTVRTLEDGIEYMARSFEIRLPKDGEEFVKKQKPNKHSTNRVMYAKPIYDTSDAAYEHDSYDLLQSLKIKFGENFVCTQADVPLVHSVAFGYFFYTDIGTPEQKKHDFDFDQYDYGITFYHFLDPTWIEPSFPAERSRKSAAANESMRCFFLHMGMAVGIHPFALQVAFRKLGNKLLEHPPAPEDNQELKDNYTGFNGDPLASVQSRGNYVDCMSLAAVWPREFDEYQVLIVNLTSTGAFNPAQGFTHIRPPNPKLISPDGEWLGKDIMLTLQNGHFTYLRPSDTNEREDVRSRPIAVMLEFARRLEFPVATPWFALFPEMFPTQFEEQYRVSIFDALREFLASERPPEPPVLNPAETHESLHSNPHQIHGTSGVSAAVTSSTVVGTASLASIPEVEQEGQDAPPLPTTESPSMEVAEDNSDYY